MHVSLAEALEVRGGPLQEEEVWAVLSQSAESLQELFRRGMGIMQLHGQTSKHTREKQLFSLSAISKISFLKAVKFLLLF